MCRESSSRVDCIVITMTWMMLTYDIRSPIDRTPYILMPVTRYAPLLFHYNHYSSSPHERSSRRERSTTRDTC